ncbi:MAG: LysM peptidoglycan-binding domain-containing protein [Frankiaceae bacterium]|nr:LysM peptidoglycan-binding domain-containing protein [Arenimonas sp.]
MLKRLLAVLTAMFLTLATFAFAAELRGDHPSTYTVQKGDTLWDISARFLAKPWLWPEIWQANPQVKNPHLIYPGDVLSLVYVNGEPRITSDTGAGAQIRTGDAIETIPLSQIEPWLKQLTVVQDPKSFPYVVGLEEDRLLTSSGQVAYVRGLVGATPGQMVQIARPMSYYAMGKMKNGRRLGGSSPVDFRADKLHSHWSYGDAPFEAYGEKLGYEMMLHSIGEVTRVQGEVAVVLLRDEGREVHVGDRVLPVEDRPYCNCFQPHAAPSIAEGAQILAVADGLMFSGPRMVVALNVGSSSGVDNGTVFSMWHGGANRPDIVRNRNPLAQNSDRVQMPDDYLGHVMVFRTFDKVSYGLVMDAIRPARVGDKLKHPDAVE